MPNSKINPDTKRVARYQSVINILLTKDSFSKSEIYGSLKEENPQLKLPTISWPASNPKENQKRNHEKSIRIR